MWSPFEIEVMLHHGCCAGEFPRYYAPIYQGTMEKLLSYGLVERTNDDENPWEVTEKGAALIQLWKDTPIPIAKFVDPRLP